MANSGASNFANIARPYARAAFDFARDKQQLPAWEAFLQSASTLVNEPRIIRLMANPEISSQKWLDIFKDVLAPVLNPEQKNFLALLAQRDRLRILPEIAALFSAYYAELKRISSVRVITAVSIDEAYQQKLAQALTKRVKSEVTLHCEVDPSLLGGAVIHIGDSKVIDGSVRGKLTRLLEFSLR